MGWSQGSLRSALGWIGGLLLISAAAYQIDRALVLRIDYFDAFAYLNNATRLAGYRNLSYLAHRPPLVPLLHLPAVLLARQAGPAGLRLLIFPHLVAVLLTALTVLAAFSIYRRSFGGGLALLGAGLLVWNRLLVRYGAHAMADIPETLLTILVFQLHGRARQSGRMRDELLCGLALACAILAKYSGMLLVPALVAIEAIDALRGSSVQPRAVARLARILAAGGMLALAATGSILLRVYGPGNWTGFGEQFRTLVEQNASASHPFSVWLEWISTAGSALGWPVALLVLAGLVTAVRWPRSDDVPFLAWVLVVGGGTMAFVYRVEARYLLPAFPALIYFALRAVEAVCEPDSPRRTTLAAVLACLALGLSTGVLQALADRDPVFTTDVERLAVERLQQARQPGGKLYWMGYFHTFCPGRGSGLIHDPFFDRFHFGTLAVEYLLGEAVENLGVFLPGKRDPEQVLAKLPCDGGAALKVAGNASPLVDTAPPNGPVEVWAIRKEGEQLRIRKTELPSR